MFGRPDAYNLFEPASPEVDPLFEQEARQHVCYKTLSELISRGCRGATAVLTEAKAKGGKAKGGKEGQQLQEGGPQPAPHLALARSGLGLMKDLQRMPAGVLLLSPVVAINVGPVAENLGKAAMNEAKPTPKTDGPPLSKLVRYMKGLCKAAGLAPSLHTGTSLLSLLNEANRHVTAHYVRAAKEAGVDNWGVNEFVNPGMALHAEPEPVGPEELAEALLQHQERVHRHVSDVLARVNNWEAERLRILLAAVDDSSPCYGRKVSAALRGAGWQELFALLYSSLPLRQLRHLRQKYLLDAGLQITEMFSPQPKPFWKPDKPSPASPPSPLVESYHSCQGTVLFDLADQMQVVEYMVKHPKVHTKELAAYTEEMLLRMKGVSSLGALLGMKDLCDKAESRELKIDLAKLTNTTTQLLCTTQSGWEGVMQMFRGVEQKLSQMAARLDASEARQQQCEEEQLAAREATQLWCQFDELPLAAARSGEGEPAGEPKAAVVTGAARDSASAEAAPAQDVTRDCAADMAGPAQGAAAGEAAAAAAAVPAGFSMCANPLFGSGGASTPLPPHGHRRMHAAAAEKEQRAAN